MSGLALLLALALSGEPVRVARLELPVPGHSPFLLRATLPLPRGIELGPGGLPALYVENHGAARAPVPAQIEIVSRAADGKPDLIELLARVELGPKEAQGAQTSYWIVQGAPAEEPAFRAPPAVDALLARSSHNLLLRALDVYGNVYQADLCGDALDPGFGSLRLVKDGRWQRELRLAVTLAPLASAQASGAALPHLMGVHAFLRTNAEDEVVGLDLRVHNGCTSGNRAPKGLELPVGAVYWRSLELLVPREWNVLPDIADPFFGVPYEEDRWRVVPLVKPLPEGRLHLMPPQAQFERRLALVPVGQGELARDELAHDGLAFAQPGAGLWSWSAPECARWLAQRAPLPELGFYRRGSEHGPAAVRAMESAREREYAEVLRSGKPRGSTIASVMGWAHPCFLNSQTVFGSEGIALNEGAWTAAGASREGYLHLQHLQRMSVCRQSEAAWTRTGDPVGYHAWLDEQGRIAFDFRQSGGLRPPCFLLPWKGGPPASEQVREVVRRGLRPPYDSGTWYEQDGGLPDRIDNLLAWSPQDDLHMLRYTKNAKALVWLGNDSLAKDDLLLSGELFHLAFHESPQVDASGSAGLTLRDFEALVKAHPHQGAALDRGTAWGIDAACAAYSVAPPAWRERNRDWLRRVARLLCDAAAPSGIIQRSLNPRVLGNERYTVTQTLDTHFLIHALRCLDESVLRGADEPLRVEVEKLALRSVNYLYWGPPFKRIAAEWQPDPLHPSIYVQGPRWGFAISENDDYKTPPFADEARWGPDYLPPDGCGGGIENTHGLWVLEWARELSDPGAGAGLDNRYLRRALEYGVPSKDFSELARELEDQTRESSRDNSANWAPFLAALQQLGVR